MRSYRSCGRDEDFCQRADCSRCALPDCECGAPSTQTHEDAAYCEDCVAEVLELEDAEQEALAEVPTAVIDVLAAGRETSLIGAVARARRGGVRS